MSELQLRVHSCAKLSLQKWDACEYFAGCGSLTAALEQKGLTVAAFDIMYWAEYRDAQLRHGRIMPENNPLDINQPSGFALPGCSPVMHLHKFSESC